MSSSTPRPLEEGFTDNLDEIVRRVPLDVPLSLNFKTKKNCHGLYSGKADFVNENHFSKYLKLKYFTYFIEI